jgi:hypothetical protein
VKYGLASVRIDNYTSSFARADILTFWQSPGCNTTTSFGWPWRFS